MDYTTLHYYSGHITLGPDFFPNKQANLNKLARLAADSEEWDTFWPDMVEIAYKKLAEVQADRDNYNVQYYNRGIKGCDSKIDKIKKNIAFIKERFIHEQN